MCLILQTMYQPRGSSRGLGSSFRYRTYMNLRNLQMSTLLGLVFIFSILYFFNLENLLSYDDVFFFFCCFRLPFSTRRPKRSWLFDEMDPLADFGL